MMRGRFRQRSGEGDRPPNLHDRILRTGRPPRRRFTMAAGHVQRRLLAGVLVFLPIFVTYFVLDFFYGIVDSLLDPIIKQLGIPHGPGLDITDVVEIFIILVILYATGLLIGWAVTRLMIDRIHDTIGRVPVIGPVYNTTRHGIDFLSETQSHQYRGVVLLEFPRPGVLSVGLITSNLGLIDGHEEHLSVYVPTTPVPSSGYLVIIPTSQVTPTDITVDEAMRMIISGGILASDVFTKRSIAVNSSWPGREWGWGAHQEPDNVQMGDPNPPPSRPAPAASTEPQD